MAIRKSKRLISIVENKDKVDFTYTDRHGKTTKRKNVEIHTLGYDKKGHSAIRAWDDTKKDWRLFHNSSITNLKKSDKQFETTKPGYNPRDKGMKNIVKSTKKILVKPKHNPMK